MNRRQFVGAAAGGGLLAQSGVAAVTPPPRLVHPGVWKFSFGSPETITPVTTRRYKPAEAALAGMPRVAGCPVRVSGGTSPRGTLVSVPLAPNEAVFGFGLQLQSFLQRGTKKKLRVNADPKMDTGDSHAPVPFYVTTRGYGVFIDSARYITVYAGGKKKKRAAESAAPPDANPAAGDLLPAAYRRTGIGEASEVLVEIPAAKGVDVYVFGGPGLRDAVSRYNLFSGGGVLPPLWGLGAWYRVKADYNQDQVLELAAEFRGRRIPCDVLGLEPGWQTHSYSCSFVWSSKFPDPAGMLERLSAANFRLNLWEHAFTHPSSPVYSALAAHSGDYEVWGGLVPDFLDPDARRIFGEYQEKHHVALGVSGYKLDECDNSDFTGNWSFPEIAAFPSGADGEQMHCLFGERYQDALQEVFDRRRTRTYGLVRNSGALAAPYPYVLYSDLYGHKEFVRGVANMGFSGILWTPELRDAQNTEDLIRRLQSVVLSPMALINAWYIQNPPWKQVQRAANNAGRLDPRWEDVESRCRDILELRMRLLPYLHAAFVRYHRRGLPPFRALVMDFPGDVRTWTIDDQYLVGESLLVAPAFAGEPERSVYFPEGDWYDFWTGQLIPGKQTLAIAPPLDRIPLYVRAGTILPLAAPALHAGDPAGWKIEARVYGSPAAPALLYEDDGSFHPALPEVRLEWDARRRAGSVVRAPGGAAPRYEVTRWDVL